MADLPSGVVFWRARSGDSVTGVWSFFVGKGTDVDSSGGTFSDFNGDGRSDVAVQADNGVVLVYYGAADGFQTPPTVLSIPDPARFAAGGDIASVGDVSGDGLADLVVAAPTTSADTHIRLYTFLGKREGIAGSPSQTLDVDSFGSAMPKVRGGLDTNADGYGDLLLSWAGSGGAVPIVGGAGLQQGKEIAVIDGTIATGMVAVCDFNGDGIQDFVVLELPVAGGGAIPIIFRGTGSAFVRDGATIPSHGTDSESFHSIACGDVQGDGYPEVIAGAPYSDVRGTGFGDVTVFANEKGMFRVPGKSVAGQEQLLQAYTGTALQMIGDMNADGVDDLAIGCGGEADVAQIAFQPLSSVPSDTLEIGGTPDTDGSFGSAFAGGDFDGDGLFDLIVGSSSHGNGQLTLFRGSRSARVLSPSNIHLDAPTGLTGFGQQVSTSR